MDWEKRLKIGSADAAEQQAACAEIERLRARAIVLDDLLSAANLAQAAQSQVTDLAVKLSLASLAERFRNAAQESGPPARVVSGE